jgi:hypothetical protein
LNEIEKAILAEASIFDKSRGLSKLLMLELDRKYYEARLRELNLLQELVNYSKHSAEWAANPVQSPKAGSSGNSSSAGNNNNSSSMRPPHFYLNEAVQAQLLSHLKQRNYNLARRVLTGQASILMSLQPVVTLSQANQLHSRAARALAARNQATSPTAAAAQAAADAAHAAAAAAQRAAARFSSFAVDGDDEAVDEPLAEGVSVAPTASGTSQGSSVSGAASADQKSPPPLVTAESDSELRAPALLARHMSRNGSVSMGLVARGLVRARPPSLGELLMRERQALRYAALRERIDRKASSGGGAESDGAVLPEEARAALERRRARHTRAGLEQLLQWTHPRHHVARLFGTQADLSGNLLLLHQLDTMREDVRREALEWVEQRKIQWKWDELDGVPRDGGVKVTGPEALRRVSQALWTSLHRSTDAYRCAFLFHLVRVQFRRLYFRCAQPSPSTWVTCSTCWSPGPKCQHTKSSRCLGCALRFRCCISTKCVGTGWMTPFCTRLAVERA